MPRLTGRRPGARAVHGAAAQAMPRSARSRPTASCGCWRTSRARCSPGASRIFRASDAPPIDCRRGRRSSDARDRPAGPTDGDRARARATSGRTAATKCSPTCSSAAAATAASRRGRSSRARPRGSAPIDTSSRRCTELASIDGLAQARARHHATVRGPEPDDHGAGPHAEDDVGHRRSSPSRTTASRRSCCAAAAKSSFTPSDPAEQGQMRLFAGGPAFVAPNRHRVPARESRRSSPSRSPQHEPDAGQASIRTSSQRAREIFDRLRAAHLQPRSARASRRSAGRSSRATAACVVEFRIEDVTAG